MRTNRQIRRDTLKAIKALPHMTARWSDDWEEYRVAYTGPNSEPSAYYTNDSDDALDTARHMSGHYGLYHGKGE